MSVPSGRLNSTSNIALSESGKNIFGTNENSVKEIPTNIIAIKTVLFGEFMAFLVYFERYFETFISLKELFTPFL